jgi:hypothetical protein
MKHSHDYISALIVCYIDGVVRGGEVLRGAL